MWYDQAFSNRMRSTEMFSKIPHENTAHRRCKRKRQVKNIFFPSNARWLSPGRLSSRKADCIQQINLINAVQHQSVRPCASKLNWIDTSGWAVLCLGPVRKTKSDSNHRLQAISRAFVVDRQTLCDENVRIMDRRRNFDAVRTSVVIFGSGKRLVRQIDLHQMDVAFRKRREIYEDCCWATLGNGLGKAMARSSSHLE